MTFVPSSTRNAETWTKNSLMETSVTAVEMAEKSRVRVACTRISTLCRYCRDSPKAAWLTAAWLAEEEGGRALTVSSLVSPEAEIWVMVKLTVEREELYSSVIFS